MQIIKATFDFNGTVVDDIQQVKIHEKEFGKEVEFVSKTGYAPVVGKNGFSIKYAPPQSGKFNFTVAQYDDDVTFSVYYDGGTSITFHKVHLLKCSENDGGDGKTEFAYTYDFTAESVTEE